MRKRWHERCSERRWVQRLWLRAASRDHSYPVHIYSIYTIDNRILISRHRIQGHLHRQKCHQFHNKEIWRTRQKTGSYWVEEYITSQLHRSSSVEVNKFLLAYTSSSWSAQSNSKRLSPRYYLPKDGILPRQSYSDVTSLQCSGCGLCNIFTYPHQELRKSDLEATARHLNEVEAVQHVHLTNIPVWFGLLGNV